jgi:serine O-acetyltransferase
MIAELRADMQRHKGLGEPESWPLVVRRLGRAAQKLPRPLAVIGSKLYGLACLGLELTLGTVLHRETEIGEGLYLVHGSNIKIHPQAVLGARVALNHNVTIGLHHSLDGAPRIGDDVFIGTGATILGPVTIGDGAIIAAGSVVMNDIPAGATALGVPARPLPERKGNGTHSPVKQV